MAGNDNIEKNEMNVEAAFSEKEVLDEQNTLNNEEVTEKNCTEEEEGENNNLKFIKRIEELEKQCEEYLDLARRTRAEFDNYRKRSAKERESLYDDGFSDAVKSLLPILDNLERAVNFSQAESSSLSEGVEMVLKMFKDTLVKMGVEEIEAEGKKFDPDFHNAVMHIEDENYEENVIVEVFQKGYKYKNKVIRYSMVKVAN
ncbi:nucleotide exchange factor GrpE [Fonticella tunisiensis]|uniref:Protein GrpE n=1 Tax=Fonticella tunisiensis TaxID=1096341 RepID=A0A4R7KA30_9CLOT|nr:nucleotide exchange factor GrpE [Fonticella tunisiensis]TDT51108.1 molecular chaperone GrpE [Fonticella tunisiensis]